MKQTLKTKVIALGAKKFIYILLLASFFGQEALAQEFVSTANKWLINECFTPMGSDFCFDHKVYFEETVTIDNIEYLKLNIGSAEPEYMSEMLYREENGKVYRRLDSGEERTLYDFNLAIGENVTIYDGIDPVIVTCTAIDSIELMNGEKRKRLTIKDVTTDKWDYWIEGVGGDKHPMATELSVTLQASNLCSFFTDDELLYTGANCALTSSLSELQLADFKIVPNPTVSQLSVQTSTDVKVANIKIFDLQGHLLGDYIDPEINVANFAAGMYLVKVELADGQFVTKRLVKL